MAKYQSTKTYGTDRGLSCCFRQWKANHSHCSTLHGYSLGFKFTFESETLDEKNWAFDFGGMKPIKQWLDYMFDHTVLVAWDDPALEQFQALAGYSTMPEYNGSLPEKDVELFNEGRVCNLRVVAGVGCEMTAKMVYEKTCALLEQMKYGDLGRYAVNPDVRLVSVECFEHSGNSALYFGDCDNEGTERPDRKVFYVDVAGMGPATATEYLEKVKNEVHQKKAPEAETASDFSEKLLQYLRGGETIKSSSVQNIGSVIALAEAALRAVNKAEKPAKQLELLKDSSPDLSDLEYFTKQLLLALRVPPVK